MFEIQQPSKSKIKIRLWSHFGGILIYDKNDLVFNALGENHSLSSVVILTVWCNSKRGSIISTFYSFDLDQFSLRVATALLCVRHCRHTYKGSCVRVTS